MSSVADGMSRLERIDFARIVACESNPAYLALFREYFTRAKGFLGELAPFPIGWPIIDITPGGTVALPSDVEHRFRSWVSSVVVGLSSQMRDASLFYLRDLHAETFVRLGLISSFYDELIEIMELGGHFYLENGMMQLPFVMVPTRSTFPRG